jgi:hypothetical protein
VHYRALESGDPKEQQDGKSLVRGRKKATRFKKSESDEEEDKEPAAYDWKAQTAQSAARKAELERLKQERAKKAQEAAEIEAAAAEEIGANEIAEEGEEAAGGEAEAGETEGLKRKKDKVTRFTKQQAAEEEVVDGYSSILERHKDMIPWVPLKKRLEQESVIYFRLGKRENVLKAARDKMRQQGLYVAKDGLMLPANVERELQRAKIRREAKAAKSSTPLEKDEGAHVASFMGVKFHSEDEKFLMPFEPLKKRSSRPTIRYDPSLSYLQYDSIVPVTVGACTVNQLQEYRMPHFHTCSSQV